MKILYIGCHAILEYDECKLFTEMGHDVVSVQGAYTDPKGHISLPRPSIEGMKYHADLAKLGNENPKTALSPELIEWADVIIIMHTPEQVTENWDRMKHKKVVWRSIGQSTKHVENMIRKARYEGLKIVRMSHMESNIVDYLGADEVIYFYKDPADWTGWTGHSKKAINFTQSLKGRRVFCHYDAIMQMLEGFPAFVYGTGNDDLGPLNGGNLPYDLMRGMLRDSRVFVYGGTWPSPYTLAFEEAWMTGIPIVAIGKSMAENLDGIGQQDRINYYELDKMIKNGENGFISDDLGQLRAYIHTLLEDHDLAQRISAAGVESAKEWFGKDKIALTWKAFLQTL